MAGTNRLTSRTEDSLPTAPGVIAKAESQTKDSGTEREDYKAVGAPDLSLDRTGQFDATSEFRDVRANRIQTLTLASYGGVDSFTIRVETSDLGRVVTSSFVRATSASAANIQAALRTATGDSDLTVTGDGGGTTSDAGPFVITHTKSAFRRSFPRYTVAGTGCTGTVAVTADVPEGDATIQALGESNRVSETDSILKPTIGVITVTNSTHRVDTLDYAASTAGGTFNLRVGGKDLGAAAWNASVAAVQALITAQAPTAEAAVVTKRGTNEVQTLTLTSFDAGDTIKLTHAGVESAAVTASAVAGVTLADFQAKADALFALTIPGYAAGACVVTQTTLNVTYVFTFSGQTVIGDQTAITATSGTGSASGVFVETTPGVHDGYVFTYPRAVPDVRYVLTLSAQALTDSGTTAKTAVFSTTTAGVLGQTSTAYTENGAGDTVLAAAVNDTTGKSYGFVGDAATPVVHIGLPNGSYHMIIRTVEDGRVSKADTKAFTVT